MKTSSVLSVAAALLVAGLAYGPAGAAEPTRAAAASAGSSGQPVSSASSERLSGPLQLVDYRRDRRVERHRRVHRHQRASRYSLRYMHRKGRWCGKWYGRRCYYTPGPLRPLRQR
ncbi:hypothetical protein [Hansschlegelia sp.]|uniref:hypothetical protein n=1 Tax=Hansschlegelia sp. TaxID=2041892 RepID=UPI002CC3C0BA|nr:hypothetical protein [Hansschlegelia sp.]HVI29469.1 hypothetical protein [Hansschlegelia sp.]